MNTTLSLLLFGGLLMLPPAWGHPQATAAPQLPSQHFRDEHADITQHLAQVEEWAGQLQNQPPEEQRQTMSRIVSFFKDHIQPHAQWEEQKLYPAVDKRASKGGEAFTSTMRFEHTIVGRWTAELETHAQASPVNVALFTRKTDQLLGLLLAHFEEEEQVLLPILDKSMTAAEFKKEIGDTR